MKKAIGALCCGVVGFVGQANGATIPANGADYNARVNYSNSGTPATAINNATNGVLTVGLNASGANALIASALLYFPLPAQSDLGGAANLSVFLQGKSASPADPQANADLYGLGFDHTSPPAQPGSYAMIYDGAGFDTNNDTRAGVGIPAVAKIQDNFFVPSSTVGQFYETDNTGDTALLNFLNSLYTAGAVQGDFAILRLNVDSKGSDSNTAWSYTISSANRSTVSEQPFVTVAPEPASLSLIGVISSALLLRRRRI